MATDKEISDFRKKRTQAELAYRQSQDHEARKRGEPSLDPRYVKDGTFFATAMREYGERKQAKEQNLNANIQSARQHEQNKARGTSSSTVRRIIK
jgi:hypothetical protein